MKFSEKWLREWVDPEIDTESLVRQLTMAGIEVDNCAPVAKPFSGVVVAKVLSVEPHPEADRLSYCQVIYNGSEPSLAIVCGASNVYTGMMVALARIGAQLPGGIEIKKAKLRGVVSEGMLCSSVELGMSDESEGILELPADAPLGEDLRTYLQLDDHEIEVDITPNRGDCWSILGLSREVGVLNHLDIHEPKITTHQPTIPDKFPVKVTASFACPRYAGRIIRGLKTNSITPLWLTQRLSRGGIKSIHPVVDVTNYVMLELGQPMHAFDLSELQGQLEIRMARDQESLTLLDEQTISLDKDCLVISDPKRALALAGIMGGEHSGIGDQTVDIFLESAFFTPSCIRGRARRYGLSTESAHRFERGIDPKIQIKALERATQLLIEIVGGQVGPIIDLADPEHLPTSHTIIVRHARVKRLLGIEIDENIITPIFKHLGMKVEKIAEGWKIETPTHRFDLTHEADLIEEIVRIYGYQHVPCSLPNVPFKMPAQPQQNIDIHSLNTLMVERDYHEIISYSFVDPSLQQLIDPASKKLKLLNPISAELSEMRSTLWSGLLATLVYNQHRQQERIQFFETGLRFFFDENQQLLQQPVIAGIVAGSAYPEQWGISARNVDFFDVKADVEVLLTLSGKSEEFAFHPAIHPALHPGQSAEIKHREKNIGWIGALHPHLETELDLTGPIYLFEIEWHALQPVEIKMYQSVSKFPGIRRDLSFLIDRTISTARIFDEIHKIKCEFLQHVKLFDLFEGKGIPENKKSMAVAFILQHPTRTLVEEEVSQLMQEIISLLQNAFGIELRE